MECFEKFFEGHQIGNLHQSFSPLEEWLKISGLPRFTRSAPLLVTHRPSPKFTHFVRCSCKLLDGWSALLQEFWGCKGASQSYGYGNLGHKVATCGFCTSAPAPLFQVELRKGKERARCYPVRGAGRHGWCEVEESEDSHEEVVFDMFCLHWK